MCTILHRLYVLLNSSKYLTLFMVSSMEHSLRANRPPSRKVVENLEALLYFQEKKKQEKRQADAHKKAREKKSEPLDVRDERLHKLACLQSVICDRESPIHRDTCLMLM